MQSTFKIESEFRKIRRILLAFMIILLLSGLTAIPAEWELDFVTRFFPIDSTVGAWLDRVLIGVKETSVKYPFLFYGYDWLAFAHMVLAVLFIGPYQNPTKNRWVIEFGIYACMMVIPFALIAGHFRGIPFWWRMIDCAFGIIGMIPLLICLKKITMIEEALTVVEQ